MVGINLKPHPRPLSEREGRRGLVLLYILSLFLVLILSHVNLSPFYPFFLSSLSERSRG
jgi:hypothetical protein